MENVAIIEPTQKAKRQMIFVIKVQFDWIFEERLMVKSVLYVPTV